MADVGWFVLSAGGAITLLGATIVWLTSSGGSPASRRCLTALALFYWIASTDVVADGLRHLLAAPFPPLTQGRVPPGRVAVVLLGSGTYGFRDWSEDQFSIVDRVGAARLFEAARVFRLVHADYVVSSGGMRAPSAHVRPSGAVMADVLVSLGVPRDRLVIETASVNTRAQALIVRELLRQRPVDHVVLVTSQMHMRRSLGTFRAVGVDAIPAVAREPESIDTWWQKWIPTDKALDGTAMAAHELIGIPAYAVRGWYR
ncbi:MAG: YdcF family protein [Acidobacteria bacterium]|nr:YdcF family protein [Acidobacteriota bacterium]